MRAAGQLATVGEYAPSLCRSADACLFHLVVLARSTRRIIVGFDLLAAAHCRHEGRAKWRWTTNKTGCDSSALANGFTHFVFIIALTTVHCSVVSPSFLHYLRVTLRTYIATSSSRHSTIFLFSLSVPSRFFILAPTDRQQQATSLSLRPTANSHSTSTRWETKLISKHYHRF
jgi:hypothetical protein